MSINLSPIQLRQPQLATDVLNLIDRAGVDPASIWLEVTEHSSVRTDVTEFVTTLRAAGVHFSLDDFGISYSNLSHLRRFPVECLKIDKSFVKGLSVDGPQQDIDRGVIRAILAIADSLDLTVIAEGIETAEQRMTLAGLGCQRGQGYLLSAALPAVDATRVLLTGPHLPHLAALNGKPVRVGRAS
jgi:EAL domain-containing protein (putative c-di-GMP-specific phosphodiesterase class I)